MLSKKDRTMMMAFDEHEAISNSYAMRDLGSSPQRGKKGNKNAKFSNSKRNK